MQFALAWLIPLHPPDPVKVSYEASALGFTLAATTMWEDDFHYAGRAKYLSKCSNPWFLKQSLCRRVSKSLTTI